MSHTRKKDQAVDAFSAPISLLEKAKIRAGQLGMTKSGFYRYSLAKEIGFTELEARAFAVHRAVLNSVESSLALADKPSSDPVVQKAVKDVAYKIRRKHKPGSE